MQNLPCEYLKDYLKMNMSNRMENLINEQLSMVTFPKGNHPINMGDDVRFFYMIIEGLVRGYYINENGIEVTKCFSYEKCFFGSECYRTNRQSTFYVECMEQCKCIKIPYAFVREIITQDSKLKEYIQVKYFEEVEKLENRAKNLLLLSAEERYLAFKKEYALIHHRIPLKYIASYMGIKPGSLSRIRKILSK